jgi:hypothetical protein
MPYYYDWVEGKWQESNRNRDRTPKQRRALSRRSNLIEELIREIELGDNSFAKLYAGLLARTLACTDENLCRQWGKPLEDISDPKLKPPPPLPRKQQDDRLVVSRRRLPREDA